MILISTLGFDERFTLRAIFRRGLRSGDKIVIVMPEKNDLRAEKAFSTLQQIVSSSVPEVKIEKIYVPSYDFARSVSFLRKFASTFLRSREKVVLSLSGGQRIVILELLAAFLSIGASGVEVEIESEDSSTVSIFPLGMMMKMDIDQEDIKILESLIESPKKLSQIYSALNMSKSSTWRRLKRLIELGLVEKTKRAYKLTDVGLSRLNLTG